MAIPAVSVPRAKVTKLGLDGLVAVISVDFRVVRTVRSGEAEGPTMFKMQVHIRIVRAVTVVLQDVEWDLEENQYVCGKPKDT